MPTTIEVDTRVVHRPAPDGCTDSDEFRDEIVSNSVSNVGLELALEAAGINEEDENSSEDATDPDETSMPCPV